jgi:hypothetical protein
VKQFLDEWFTAAQITTGKLFRCVCRLGTVWGDGMTEKVVWHVVKLHAKKLQIPRLAPHDLRSYAERQIMPNVVRSEAGSRLSKQ